MESSSDDEAPQAVTFSKASKNEKNLRKIAPVKKKLTKKISKPVQKATNLHVKEDLTKLLDEKLDDNQLGKYDKIINTENAIKKGPKKFEIKVKNINKVIDIDDNEKILIDSRKLVVDKKINQVNYRMAILNRGTNNRRSMNCLK